MNEIESNNNSNSYKTPYKSLDNSLNDTNVLSLDFFCNFINLIDDAIIISNKDKKIIYINKSAEQMFKCLPSEFLNNSIYAIFKKYLRKNNFKISKNASSNNSNNKSGNSDLEIEIDDVNNIIEHCVKSQEKIIEKVCDKYNSEIIIELSIKKYEKLNNQYYIFILRDISSKIFNENKLKYLSFHDRLTGLYNRSYFEEELRRLNTSRQLPLSIIIGDIDGLKLVNDAFGYKAGDKVLKSFSKLLKSSCRAEDVLARWGGDEFVILLPKTNEESVLEIVQRIEKQTKRSEHIEIPFSISLGYAVKKSSDQLIYEVIKKAENLMKKNKLMQSKKVSDEIISFLKKQLNQKSGNSDEIFTRIKNLALEFGKELRLTKEQLDKLLLVAEYFDVGKVVIKKNILKKRTILEEDEWQVMKMHPEIGYKITKSSTTLAHIADDILAHHENWDGSGYPYGIKASNIPLNARIIAIIEAYDAMTNGRSHKKPISKEKALQELKKLSKIQFDPKLVNKFISMINKKDNCLSLFQISSII